MQLLTVEKTDFATIAILNDPSTRNAMSPAMTQEWVSLVSTLEDDPGTRCLIVSGFGDIFSSGGVLQWLADVDPSVEAQQQKMLDFYRDWLSFRGCSFPVICALNGAAIGAAAVFASACDLRVASDSASISVPFTSLGIHPGMATTWFLERSLSPGLSTDLLLTGRALSGEELQMSGFANQNVSAEELVPTAIGLAKAINRTSQAATQATLASIREPLTTLDASLERDAARQARSMHDKEFLTRIARLIKR